jgi:hypothetical protein
MQESLEDHDERQVERMKNGSTYEPLEVINARRAFEGLPPLVPFVPPVPKQRRRASAK